MHTEEPQLAPFCTFPLGAAPGGGGPQVTFEYGIIFLRKRRFLIGETPDLLPSALVARKWMYITLGEGMLQVNKTSLQLPILDSRRNNTT